MVKGIGIDMVRIERVDHLLRTLKEGALKRMFAEGELAAADHNSRPAEYLATRFAVKEAVFKAVAPLLPEKHFDLRLVETRNHEDGSPYVHISEELSAILYKAHVSRLLVSITTEGEYAAAFVTAVDD